MTTPIDPATGLPYPPRTPAEATPERCKEYADAVWNKRQSPAPKAKVAQRLFHLIGWR